jgi:hypothetical protein
MVLSNSAKSFLTCVMILLVMQGCKWWERTGNGSAATKPKSEIPFAAIEPEVFQCQIVLSNGEYEQKSFYARKNGNLRFQISVEPSAADFVLLTDRYYRIDDDKKIYAEMPQSDTPASEPEFLSDLTLAALKQNAAAKFEKLGQEGGLVKYGVKIGDSDNAKAIVYVDESTGLIMKEEFFSLKGQDAETAPSFVFELRDLKMEVDDGVFTIPQGYKKLSWGDYLKATKTKK